VTPGPGGPGERVARLTGSEVTGLRRAGSQHRWDHYQVTLADGRTAFAKAAREDLAGLFEAEARGLAWLGEAGAVPVPEVLGWDDATLVVSWVPAQSPSPAAAERFGHGLAALHEAGAAGFGAPWKGFIASLPLPNQQADSWPAWYASQRLLPYLRRAADAGTLSSADVGVIETVIDRIGALAGPAEPASRIHGDCWSGNLLWSGGEGWLIDPAAHGGHRESDLAMLALFGAPYLAEIMAGYQEVWPLADGWAERVGLHQLQPLLVHTVLFGGGYGAQAVATARQYL
jgi:fructosamine-3-kinase